MGRVEAVDACGLVSPARRVEQQKFMKDTQFTLRSLGKGSPDRNDVEAIYTSPARQPSQKIDTGHRSRNLNPIVKQEVFSSVRTKIPSREPVLETGRTGGRIIGQNPTKGEDDSFELFKKEFIEKLAEKAKERPGYLLANEDFVKPVKGSPKLFKKTDEDFLQPLNSPLKPHSMLKQTDQEFVKAVKAHSGLKQSDEDNVKPLNARLNLFKQTESLAQPSSLVGSLSSRKDFLEQTMRVVESSRTFCQSSPSEKRKFSPPREKLSDPNWVSKSEKLNLSLDKQAWSKSKGIEETSRDFILNKFFQMPTRPTKSIAVDDVYATDEEATPRAYSSRRRILSTDHNATQKTNIGRQQSLTREQNVGQMTEQGEQSRKDQEFDSSGKILEDVAAQIRREMTKASSGSPGRPFSSEERRNELSRSPARRFLSEDGRKDSSRSPGRKLSSEVKRNDLSRSPGRRILSQDERKNSLGSPGRGASPEERRKESSPISITSREQGLAAEDLGKRGNSATSVPNESPVQTPQREIRGMNTISGSESKKSPRREKEAMLESVKKAAAVDQAHFLRALHDNGAVQSSTHIMRSSSPNGTKTSSNLKEGRGNCRVDAREDFPSEETRHSEPSPTRRRDGASFGSSNRSREPSPTGRREATSGSTNAGRATSLIRSQSLDSSSLRNGEIQRNGSGERSQLPSRGNYQSCGSPRLSRQSSSRSSIGTDEFEGGSIIEKLMRKASLRNSLSSAENQSISSSVSSSPNHRFSPPPLSNSKTGLRRTLSFGDVNKDISRPAAQSPPVQTRPSSPTSCGTLRRTGSVAKSEDLSQVLNERKSSPSRANSVVEQSAAPPPAQQSPLNNSLRVNVQFKESTIAKLKSRSSTSPVISVAQKLPTVKSVEEPCGPIATEIATSERTLSPVTSSGSPWSPGSDDSSSEASGIEQPSPVSVLPGYNNNRRTPFQEDSRLSPLEQKLQVLHERIRKSKTDVTNQKKARLEKIKAREAELQLCIVTKLKAHELLGIELPKAAKPSQTPEAQAPQAHLPSRVEKKKKKPSACWIAVTRDEKLEKARPALPISDFSTSLETFDLKKIKPWTQDKKWDLVYIRDVLLVSNFGRDRSTVTKWHSITDPMDPCLFDKLEDFYRLGKKFPGSQFLSRLAPSKNGEPTMQEYVQRVFFNAEASLRGAVDTMNRCHLFDAVNETLAKKLAPFIALPRPWMKPLTKPVVRPRPTGSELMQEIWTDIYDQIGTNGSMSMDKAQLHQSLEDLIYEDLFKRTDVFPSREVERAAERVGIELERRILDDLLEETIISLRKSV